MSGPSTYPRLLFVTPHAFNHVTGGGVAFTNLFRGWPAERILTAHNDPEPTSDEVCRQYFRLGPSEIDLAEPFASMRRLFRKDSGCRLEGEASSQAEVLQPRLKSTLKRAGIQILGDAFPERSRLTPELERRIGTFQPDLLYSILGSNGMMALVEQILARFDIPLVVHFMDDWPAAAHRNGLFARRERRCMEAHLERLIARAEECIAISPTMAAAYAERYGREFDSFQNAIDVGRWRAFSKTSLAIGKPPELLYVGSIFANAQLESLTDCAKAVAALYDRGCPIRFSISTPSGHGDRYRDRLAIHPAIAIEDTIRDDSRFYARIAKADALLVPVNFDTSSVRFIQYSMPAKLPAYMVSGTPILVYGSPSTTQVQYAQRGKWAHVVDRRDPEMLTEGICTIMQDDDLRSRISETARRIVVQSHDAAAVRTKFHAALRNAAYARRTESIV
jgi:glycosyltransferase involved in cell wall biosynthesis